MLHARCPLPPPVRGRQNLSEFSAEKKEGHAPKASHQRTDVLPLLGRAVETADEGRPGEPNKGREHGRGALDNLDDALCTLRDARVGAVDEEDL